MRTSYGAARPLIGQESIKPSRKWNRTFIVAAFLLIIGGAVAYFTLYHPMQSSAVGVNRQYAVEEFPEADIDDIDDYDIQSHYGTGSTTSKRGGKGGKTGKVKPSKAPKPAKEPKTKPSKAPKIKPSKAPKTPKTPKTTDPTTAAPVTPNPTTSWPTGKPTNRPTTPRPTNKPTPRPTTGWPTAKPTNRPTAKPTPKPTPRVTPQPTAWQTAKPVHVNPPGMTCKAGAKGVLSTKGALDDFIIGLDMDCDAQRVTVSITKNAFTNTWFGIVFSDHMIGTSLIYTVGNPGAKEQDRDLALYQYKNGAKSSRKVQWDSSIVWTEESVKMTDDEIKIVYSAPIDGSPLDLDTKEVRIRAAFGLNDYNIEYHTVQGRTDNILTLNLVGEGEEN